MTTFSDMRREPSMLDLATVSSAPGGASVYTFPTPEAIEADRAAREANAAAHARASAERDRDASVVARVRSFVALEPSHGGSAASRLLMHLDWSKACERQAEAAADRAMETDAALTRLDAARAELAVIKQSVRSSFEDWTRFGGTGDRPATCLRELTALHDEIASLEPLAAVADAAAFEAEVAGRCVAALALMLPIRRTEALTEATAPAIVARIAAAADVIRQGLNILAALAEAGRPDWETQHDLDLIGVHPSAPLVRTGATVQFPRFTGAPADIVAKPDAAALERYRVDLAGDLASPSPAVDRAPSPPSTGRKSLAATIRAIVTKEPTS